MEERSPEILFAGGGTGGHLFPALAVADEVKRRHPRTRIGFVGSRRGIESRMVPRAGYRLRTLPLSGLKGAGPARRARAAIQAGLATVRCAMWMVRSRPALVVGVGGFASGPAVLAARLTGIKTMIMEQNHFPGATNRWLAGRVNRVCLPSEAARQRLGGIGTVTGNPVRREFERIGPSPSSDPMSLLVFGGSRGARSINTALLEAVPKLAAASSPPLIVHQAGVEMEETVREAYARSYPDDRFEVQPFFDDMPARLERADFVICRAGATTLAELAAAGRPALLVPYPYAADDHQRHNAETVVAAGGALMVLDSDLSGEFLATMVMEMAAAPGRRTEMAEAARRLAVPGAAGRIADVMDDLLGSRMEEPAHVS